MSEEEKDWRIREAAWERVQEVMSLEKRGLPPSIAVEAPPAEIKDGREQLFQRVLQDYPGPIALTCRDYLIQPEPLNKLKRLLDLFEITLGFCGVLMMAQYRQQVESAQERRPKSLALAVGSSCRRINLGTWRWILNRLIGISGSIGKTQVGSKLQRFLNESGDAIQYLIDLRNREAHGALRADKDYYRQQLTEAEVRLIAVLKGLSFLADISLIQVDNLRRQGDKYLHRARLYRGDNPNFPWIEFTLHFPLECDKLLVIYHQNALILHPLLVVERCPVCGQKELFLYQRLDNDELVYHSFSSGHPLHTIKLRAEIANLLGI